MIAADRAATLSAILAANATTRDSRWGGPIVQTLAYARVTGPADLDDVDAASVLEWLRWNDRDGEYPDELADNLDDALRALVSVFAADLAESAAHADEVAAVRAGDHAAAAAAHARRWRALGVRP